MKWCLLPILTDSRSKLCRNLNGRFIGDPSYEYEHIETKVVGEGEDAEEETNTVSFGMENMSWRFNSLCSIALLPEMV